MTFGRKYALLLCLFILGPAACGGSSGAASSENLQQASTGPVLTMGGVSYPMTAQLVARDANGDLLTLALDNEPSNADMALIFTTDPDGLCADFQGNRAKKATPYANVALLAFGDRSIITEGAYTTSDGSAGGVVTVTTNDVSCTQNSTQISFASSGGTVVITHVGSASDPTQGTIDLALAGDKGSLSGTFSASPCTLSTFQQGTSCY